MPVIRFRLGTTPIAERLAFGYSPLIEALLSLHVLAQPQHHPLQHAWVRTMRRILAPELKREINAFSFTFDSYVAVPIPPRGGYPTFEQELERLAALEPDELVTLEFTLPFLGGAAPRDPSAPRRPEVRQAILAAASDRDPAARELAELALDRPREFLERFAGMLRAFWDEAFAKSWARVEPVLAKSVEEAGRHIAAEGIFDFLASLRPEIRVDPRRHEFSIDRVHEHDVSISDRDQLLLMPSVYIWPHVRINCDSPRPYGLIYPAPSLLRQARPRIPPKKLVMALRAFADDTRLRALQRIAERPRSTQELAPLVNVTEAALSGHLRVLSEAGIVTTKREGHYVLYSIVPERLEELMAGLRQFLWANGA